MTEYDTSPESIEEYFAARQRTRNWVGNHDPNQTQFHSPSVPPTILDEALMPSVPPTQVASPSESIVSLPPRMILKYNDGRPDVPISHWHYTDAQRGTKGRRKKHHDALNQGEAQSHDWSWSSRADDRMRRDQVDGLSRSHRRQNSAPNSPEEIRILPSHPDRTSPSQSQSQRRPRSNSSPRDQYPPTSHFIQTPQSIYYDPNPFSLIPGPPPRAPPRPHPILTRSVSAGHRRPSKSPPSIVYAPSRHSNNNYVPPKILHSPLPTHFAPGVTYSHSTPVPLPSHAHRPLADAAPPPNHGSSQLSSVDEERPGRPGSRKNSHQFMDSAVFVDDVGETESFDSGSTYYVLPHAGQKVHVIQPDGVARYSATSSSRSPTSPQPISKKPFFVRLLEKLTIDTSPKGLKRLRRRHSTDSSGRREKGYVRAS